MEAIDSEPLKGHPENGFLSIGRFDRTVDTPINKRSTNTLRAKVEAIMKLKPGAPVALVGLTPTYNDVVVCLEENGRNKR